MAKIVNISEIHPTLGFTEFDILEKYRKSFNESELGKLHSVFPFECMAKAAGLSDRRLGRRNRFSPSAKIALMVLKAYTGFSDRQLVEHLNGNIHYQIFCGIMIPPSLPITNFKIVSAIRNEIASRLDIDSFQELLASHWKPYLDNLHVCMTDATCYESHMRFPTDMKLLWESLEWLYRHICRHCRELGIRRPRNKYRNVAESYLSYCKKRKRRASRARMLKRRMIKLLEKLLSQRDGIHSEYGALLRYTQDYHKRLSIIRKVLVQEKEMFEGRKVSARLMERLRRKEILDKGTGAVLERLKKAWQYAPNQAAMEELLAKGRTEQTLFTIDGQAYTGTMFTHFASSHPQAVKRQLEGFIAKSLLDYESRNIDKKHPEIPYALRESDENYLVEEITRQKIDLPAANDRAGLATYFKFHSSDYRWESPRYRGVVLHCVDKKTAKQAKKMLKKVPEKEWADKLRQTFNTSGEEKIQVEQGIFADGDNKYIDKLVFKKGDFDPLMSYPFTIVVGEKMKGPDDYREVIDRVRKDYRSYLDTCWMRELSESGKVEINQEVLKTVNNN